MSLCVRWHTSLQNTLKAKTCVLQTLYRSIGMSNKTIWMRYKTDNCSATITILNNVATPDNGTPTQRQHFSKTVHKLSVNMETVSPLFFMTAFHLSDIEPMRVCTVVKEIIETDCRDFQTRWCSITVSVWFVRPEIK